MHDISTVFGSLALLAALGITISLLLTQLRLPVVAGLLLAGAVAGPHGLGLVGDLHLIEVLAEVGVVLLLFTIGLEFSLARLRVIAKSVLVGGSLQVGLTMAGGIGLAKLLGLSTGQAVFVGFVFALSSTAIVLRALGERAEIDAPHGRFIVGVLIFQDLVVIPMILLVPVLAGTGSGDAATQIGMAMGKAALVVVAALLIGRVVLPRALRAVDASRSREVFVLALLAVCLGAAWLTSAVGLSVALGAFVAGVVLADTEFAHRAMGDVVPIRDLLTSIFFMSMGMLFDIRVVIAAPALVLGLLAAFVFGKGIIAAIAAMAMRFPARVAWLAGAALAKFGEFGFVLSKEAERAGLMSRTEMEPILAAGLLSMFITRVVISVAPRFTAGEVILSPLAKLLRVQGIEDAAPADRHLKGHVIVAGYGPGGRLVAARLKAAGVPYLVLDLNAETVRKEREGGERIYYGDITSAEAQEHAGLEGAEAVVLTINDGQAAQRSVAAIRKARFGGPVLARVRYVAEEKHLIELGATSAVAEEVHASEVLAAELLRQLDRATTAAEPADERH
ncbi:MAG: cation:proton antiporter [Deltaproteobacteria bacterium]|jgi:CPA2 family monovalent cation:H+ antiporter-2|nr:cation:proton antiporter [Deltaproteobacteria bacterium]MBW2535042.1 cation:proton antiporter [Deltaproteobacteria bacterium]